MTYILKIMSNTICDIIILTLNQPDVLRPCVESVLKHTKIPSHLIIVNNGGGENIRDYCAALTPTEYVTFKFYDFPENIGFVRGNNKAAEDGDSHYVCLLNNDCIVTPGWLERMIDLAEKNPRFAAVNPQCNTLITQKAAESFSLEERSRYFEQFKGNYYVLGSAIGFCMLVPRRIIKEIGLFNEEIDTAYFEDSDFSYRAREAGYECVVAADAYVYHQPFGKASSISMTRRQALIAKNRKWFENKWGKAVRLAIVYDHRNGNDEELKSILDQAQKIGLYDNHPHLILKVDKKRFPNFEDLLRAFQIDRTKSPNLKATLIDNPFFYLYAALRVGFKWRKRYDAVVCDKISFLTLLVPFTWFLRFSLIHVKWGEGKWSTFASKQVRSFGELSNIRKEMRDGRI